MSEAVSALPGAVFDGLVRIEEVGLQGMITLRGDLASAAVKKAAAGAAGVDMPGPGEERCDGQNGLLWMSPDELLVLCPYSTVADNLARMRKAFGKAHALAVDVSDARASFRISGPAAREVLAKLCPVDLSPGAFQPGQFRRTRMAQIPAAIWMRNAETFQIVCFRSVADYAFGILKAAAQPGSEVGAF